MSRIGDVPAGQTMSLTIALRPQAPDAVDKTIRAIRFAASPAYLSPDDVAITIGQPRSTIDLISQYFRGFGLTVDSPSRDHLSVKVAGTPSQLQQALGVQFGTYQDRLGQLYFATSVDPQLPSGLAPVVQAIFGLDDYRTLRRLNVRNSPTPGGYVPADLRTAYNMNPLLNARFNGNGQTIGIIGCDTFSGADIQSFQQAFGLPTTTVTTVSVDGGPTGTLSEATLDLEWSQAFAPNAAIRYYASTGTIGCSLLGFFDSVTLATNENIASVISISLGLCESDFQGTGLLGAVENKLATAAAQGQSVFVASGDQGAFACRNGTVLGVSYPASSAFVTSVGGTRLNLNPDGSYRGEAAWGDLCAGQMPCGGGGGISGVVPEPSWQSGASVPIPATGGMRGVPDISLNSDPATGDVIILSNPGLGCFSGVPCPGFGGTSIASPQWAGIASIANQYAGRRLGQFAPLLYSSCILGSRLPPTSVYHDVTIGDTGNPQFYPATANWDFATGWGTPNTASLVSLLSRAGTQAAVAGSSPARTAATSGVSQVFLPIVTHGASQC